MTFRRVTLNAVRVRIKPYRMKYSDANCDVLFDVDPALGKPSQMMIQLQRSASPMRLSKKKDTLNLNDRVCTSSRNFVVPMLTVIGKNDGTKAKKFGYLDPFCYVLDTNAPMMHFSPGIIQSIAGFG